MTDTMAVQRLDELVRTHDVCFALTDSREARYAVMEHICQQISFHAYLTINEVPYFALLCFTTISILFSLSYLFTLFSKM